MFTNIYIYIYILTRRIFRIYIYYTASMVDDYHQRQIQHGIWDFVHMGLKQDKHGVNHETWGLERRSRQTKTKLESLDWLKGKSTGNHGFYH